MGCVVTLTHLIRNPAHHEARSRVSSSGACRSSSVRLFPVLVDSDGLAGVG